MRTGIDPHLKSYVCIHVFENTRPVLLVSRVDGDWCFLCGGMHDDSASSYRVVGIGHLIDRDPTLVAILDLESDWEAERAAVDQRWLRTQHSSQN